MGKLEDLLVEGNPSEIFALSELVAKGSYGSVFKAEKDNEIVACKIIQMEDEESMEECITELQILSKCRHVNIVGYCGAYKHED